MPVLVEPDAARAANLVSGLGDDGTHSVVPDLVGLDQWLGHRTDEHMVVLGPSVSLEDAGHLAQRLLHTQPGCTIALVRQDLTTEVFTYAMAVGIPVVLSDRDPSSLRAAVDRARITWQGVHGADVANGVERAHDGKVITVFSPKGGVGKTTVAVNLAAALAGSGNRVCIVDLDLSFGDVAITLQVIPKHSIGEAVGAGEHLDFALLNSLLMKYDDNLAILAAPTSPDVKDRIPAALVSRALTTLRQHFDYVVVDTSPGFEDHVLQSLDTSDELVLVCTLDVPTVKNLKMAIETLDLLHLVPHGRHLIVNRADDNVGLALESVESILGTKVSIALPSDIDVAHATNAGLPIVLGKPDHPVTRRIHDLAATVSGAPTSGPQVPEVRRRLFGRRR